MRGFAFCFAAILVALPARADWQFTKWGMTPEQVIVASHHMASPLPDGGACVVIPGSGSAKLSMPYTSGDLTFDAIFCFNSRGGLSTIDLKTDGSHDLAITMALRTKYGKPIHEDPADENAAFVEWSTDKDLIRYARFLNQADIVYVPRHGGNAGGL